MKQNKKKVLLTLIAALLLSAPVLANATATIKLESENSSVLVDPTSDAGMYEWKVNNINQMQKQWFWYSVGDTAEAPINRLTLAEYQTGDTDADGKNDFLRIVYTGANFNILTTYSLTGTTDSSSTIEEKIRVTNTGTSSLDFHFFQYTNYNLGDTPNNDVALRSNKNTILQGDSLDSLVDWQFEENPEYTQSETGATTPTHWAIDYTPNIIDSLEDTTATVLGDADACEGQPGDISFAFQWNKSIAPNQNLIISKIKTITPPPVPEPASLLLLASGLIGVTIPKVRKGKKD